MGFQLSKVRILGHTSREIAINYGVPQGSRISPLLFLLYMSITRSDLIKSNLQTSMDTLTLFNSDHRIILSCTKSVRVLFERRKTNSLKPQDVTYNGQVIPSSSSVKFLGITFYSTLTFRSHFRTVATLARHRLLKLNSIFSTTYGPSISTLYGAPATFVASPAIQLSWGEETNSFHFASTFYSILHPQRQKRKQAYLPPIHDRNLYLAKRWYRRATQHNRGVQDYIDNHTHDNRNIRISRNTPLELIRN